MSSILKEAQIAASRASRLALQHNTHAEAADEFARAADLYKQATDEIEDEATQESFRLFAHHYETQSLLLRKRLQIMGGGATPGSSAAGKTSQPQQQSGKPASSPKTSPKAAGRRELASENSDPTSSGATADGSNSAAGRKRSVDDGSFCVVTSDAAKNSSSTSPLSLPSLGFPSFSFPTASPQSGNKAQASKPLHTIGEEAGEDASGSNSSSQLDSRVKSVGQSSVGEQDSMAEELALCQEKIRSLTAENVDLAARLRAKEQELTRVRGSLRQLRTSLLQTTGIRTSDDKTIEDAIQANIKQDNEQLRNAIAVLKGIVASSSNRHGAEYNGALKVDLEINRLLREELASVRQTVTSDLHITGLVPGVAADITPGPAEHVTRTDIIEQNKMLSQRVSEMKDILSSSPVPITPATMPQGDTVVPIQIVGTGAASSGQSSKGESMKQSTSLESSATRSRKDSEDAILISSLRQSLIRANARLEDMPAPF